MELDLKKLREIAQAATPGPWVTVDDGFHAGVAAKETVDLRKEEGRHYIFADICGGEACEGYFDGPDADFIASFNPQVALALLDLIERQSEFGAGDEAMLHEQAKRLALLETVAEAAKEVLYVTSVVYGRPEHRLQDALSALDAAKDGEGKK